MGEINMLLVGTLAGVVLALVLLGPALRPIFFLNGAERSGDGGGCGAVLAGVLIFIVLALAAGGA